MFVCPHIQTPVFYQFLLLLCSCAEPKGGIGGPDPPWKITGYMGFYRNKHLDPPEEAGPPHPPENVGPPLDHWKSIVISVIKPLDPFCKL